MRVVLDATPLLGRRTGVGRYTERLLTGLVELVQAGGAGRPGRPGRLGRPDAAGSAEPVRLAATAFTWRGAELADVLPAGVQPSARRVPARLLQEAWTRGELPPVEWISGSADVVHATNFVLPPLRRAAGVMTVHDLSYLLTPDTVTAASARYADLVPRGLRRASIVLTPSQAVADELVAAYRVDTDRVVVTPLGVDSSWFDAVPASAQWLARHSLPERYLVFVGSAEPRKNLPVLLEAIRVLRASRSDVPPLVLVGPPGWGPTLDVAGLPADAVVPAGYLDDADLRAVVAGAVASCFPSRYEGFGLPPLEALAAGTPVIASDVPAVREVVGAVAGKAVRLVPPSDADAFADALAGVLDGIVDTASGRIHARSFTWRRTAELTLAVYRRVAA